MSADSSVAVSVAVAASLSAALHNAFIQFDFDEEHLSDLRPPVVVADPFGGKGGSALGKLVVQEFASLADEVQTVVPDRLASVILRKIGRGGRSMVQVDPGDRAERMANVWLPASIVEAGTLVAVNDLSLSSGPRPVIAIGLWARFAGWRERLGVLAAKPEQALAADIALAVRPSLILLAGRWRNLKWVVATSDQIAAELVGLALTRIGREAADDEIGPWQDELVQRATELDLGVRLPEQMRMRVVLGGTTRAVEETDARMWVGRIAEMIGIGDLMIAVA